MDIMIKVIRRNSSLPGTHRYLDILLSWFCVLAFHKHVLTYTHTHTHTSGVCAHWKQGDSLSGKFEMPYCRFNWFRGEPWRKEVIPPAKTKSKASVYTISSEIPLPFPHQRHLFYLILFHLRMLEEHLKNKYINKNSNWEHTTCQWDFLFLWKVETNLPSQADFESQHIRNNKVHN